MCAGNNNNNNNNNNSSSNNPGVVSRAEHPRSTSSQSQNSTSGKMHQPGPGRRCLVSKLFDVCSRSTLVEMEKKDEIKIPWGTGIVGYVAESGEPVNIPDAYKVTTASNISCNLRV